MIGSQLLRQLARKLMLVGTALTILTCATEAQDRQMCLFDFALLGTGAGIICEEATQSAAVDTSCYAFAPIRYSRMDTAETRRQIREHNAAWDSLCKAPSKK